MNRSMVTEGHKLIVLFGQLTDKTLELQGSEVLVAENEAFDPTLFTYASHYMNATGPNILLANYNRFPYWTKRLLLEASEGERTLV